MTVRYFILGLLTRQPMSGYDIKQFVDDLSWLIGSLSAGSLYPALRGLLEDELATVEITASQSRPPRKVYSITERGCCALQEWSVQPANPHASLRAFLMRLIAAGSISRSCLLSYLEQRWRQVDAHQASLMKTVGELGVEADLGQRLALDYGLAIARAELDCLDNMLEQLAGEPTSEEVLEDERVASAA